ncbi:hypothetical protein AMECASPLE_038571 [Ameca splendens]|uniref:Uncharacterized protein n=1 Tax=Ameca splendens TaxID=208324 RepID=A0ABV0Y843_9TELE
MHDAVGVLDGGRQPVGVRSSNGGSTGAARGAERRKTEGFPGFHSVSRNDPASASGKTALLNLLLIGLDGLQLCGITCRSHPAQEEVKHTHMHIHTCTYTTCTQPWGYDTK